jgi:undecaprenyl-diphosphatase
MLDTVATLDATALSWTLSLPHPDWLNTTMTVVSAVGQLAAIWLGLGALFATLGRLSWMAYWQVVLSIILVFLTIDVVLKPMVARERPSISDAEVVSLVPTPSSHAFPSGHAATAVAGAYGLSRLLPQARYGLWFLAVLIAGSRVYLGVHYPFDVLCGGLVGLACAMFSTGGTVWYSRQPAIRVSQGPR